MKKLKRIIVGIDKGEVIDAKRKVNKILLEYISNDILVYVPSGEM